MTTLKDKIRDKVADILAKPEEYNIEDVTEDFMEEITNHINR